jgi:hypothetical protein
MNSVTVEKIAEIFIDNQIDELREVCISHVFATNYAKSTEIWLSFACLHFYEQFKDKYFLDYATKIVCKQVYWDNLSVFYGIPCMFLLQIYHYQITKQKMSLDLAQRSLERIIANVELNSILQEKEDLQDIHLLCALFVSLDQCVGNIWFKEFLDDVTDKVVNIQQSNLLSRNKSIWKIAPHLNQSKKLLKENVLLKILETINFATIKIFLSENNIGRMQIQRNFPRVSKRISVNEFSQYFRGSLKSTSLFFLKHFKPKDEQTTSLFSLERYVFTYRQEILKDTLCHIERKNRKELVNAQGLLSLQNDKLYNMQFKCADEIRILNLPYYESLEIEEVVNEASTHAILLKPSFSAGKTIEIKEFQIEGYVKLLTPLYREQCSMSPSDLHEIIEGSRKNEKNKNFCLSVFRKLILQRLIVKK